MEHFQWTSMESSRAISSDPDKLEAVSDELADVLCYVLALANELEIDLSLAMRSKMAKNQQKYPADEFRGRYGPDDPSG
jgi:NTP pyrophosphatase (non-canonical NTP hydrolase)